MSQSPTACEQFRVEEVMIEKRFGTGRPLRVISLACAIAAVLGVVAVGVTLWVIHQSVHEHCRMAQQAHPHAGDDVAALIDYLDSPDHSLRDKDRIAVWTLGRLRDRRALPALRARYTGEPCDHERGLCQHELSKAILRCAADGELSPGQDIEQPPGATPARVQ
jgi:hypothetical protein